MVSRRFAFSWMIAASFVAACDRLPFAGANESGGAYVVLEVDAANLREAQLQNLADQMATALREASPAIRYTGRGVVGDAARVRLVNPPDQQRALTAFRALATSPDTNQDMFTLTVAADSVIEARFTPERLTELSQQASAQSMEVIRHRLQQSNIGGAQLEQEANFRIRVRAPRVTDPSLLRRSVGPVGQLTFHMVREVSPEEAAAGLIPPGTMVVAPYPDFGGTNEVVERRPRFTGERLTRVNPMTDPITGEYALAFALDSEGTRIFCRVTRENTGQRFAVLLDNQVLTAPRINEPICGGTGQISGNFTAQSANELTVTLIAGALPAPMIVVEEGVIPPAP